MFNTIYFIGQKTCKGILLILGLTGIFMGFQIRAQHTVQYTIVSQSQLYLEGSTNVNKFTCDYANPFMKGVLQLESTPDGRLVRFKNAILGFEVERFDCHNKLMNKDLYKALKSEQHPEVKIQLLDIRQEAKQEIQNCADWVTIQANTLITISGVSKTVTMPIKAKKINSKQYQFSACQDLLMTDFGITPPAPFFGTIKVRDKITIHLIFLVEVLC